jgi:hypothetical protein
MVNFDQVEAVLIHADMQAAEAHGVLLGMLSAAGKVQAADWWGRVHDAEEAGATLDMPPLLLDVYTKTVDSLFAVTGTFDLLLPDDEEPLEARAEALHEWCYGFLYGYGVAGGRDLSLLPEEAAEVLRDISQFAQARFDLGEDEEEDELSYSELVEYLRVGVMLLHEVLYPREPENLGQARPAEVLGEDEPLDIEDLWAQIAKAKAQTLH